MTALSVIPPYPVFFDSDGQPLEDGYIWIGQAYTTPQNNLIAVYFDDALTIPAQQPLRTINGYVSRNGSPAQIYINGVSFSISVQDKNGAQVYTFPSGSGINPNSAGVTYNPGPDSLMLPGGAISVAAALDNLSDDEDGSSYVGFIQAGSGAVPRTLQAKVRENVSPKDYGTTNTGTEIQAAIAYLSSGGDGSGPGGVLDLARTKYTIDSPLKLFNDIRIDGTAFNSPIFLADNANCNMMEIDSNRSRIVLDGVWLDGNWTNQTGVHRGFTVGSNQIYQWSVQALHVQNCSGAGFWVEGGTVLQIDKLDITFCATSGLEPDCVLPDQTLAQEISLTARSDGNASLVKLRMGSDCSIDHLYLENAGGLVEFRGDSSTVRNAFHNNLSVTAVFNGYGNSFEKSTGQRRYTGSFFFQDNGSHNTVTYDSLYNKHNTLEILHPGDGVNPYFIDGELHWTGVQRLRNAASVGQQEINIPCQVAAQTNADTASKVVPVLASGEYLVEYWYASSASGNATSMTINDGTSNVLASGNLTNGYAGLSPVWRKYTGLATMGGSATDATMTITSTGTNINSFANWFTGARMIQSQMVNGGFEGSFVGGVAANWTSGGSGGTFSQETTIKRSGANSQKIVASGGTPTLTSDTIVMNQGVTYLVGGYVKISTVGKSVTAQFNTGNLALRNTISQLTADGSPDGWQAFQFVVLYDDFNSGAVNQLRFTVPDGTTCYIDDVYCIPLVRAGLENPTRLVFESPIDLSGSAATKWMSVLSNGSGLYLSHVNLTYTEATSADAGVAINVGRYRASSGTDATHFGTLTSEINKVQYSNTQMKLTRHINGASNANIAIACPGGKTGAGEFVAEIVACPL